MLGAMTLRRRFDRGKEAEVGGESAKTKQKWTAAKPRGAVEKHKARRRSATGWKDVLWRVYDAFKAIA